MNKKFSKGQIVFLMKRLRNVYFENKYILLSGTTLKKEMGFNDLGKYAEFNWGSFLSLMIKNDLLKKTSEVDGMTPHRHPNYLYKFVGFKRKHDENKNVEQYIFSSNVTEIEDINKDEDFLDLPNEEIHNSIDDEDSEGDNEKRNIYLDFPNGKRFVFTSKEFKEELDDLIIFCNKINKKLTFKTLVLFE